MTIPGGRMFENVTFPDGVRRETFKWHKFEIVTFPDGVGLRR